MFKKCIAIILLTLTVFSIFPMNAGGSIADLRYKQQQIENQIQEIRKKADALKGEKKTIEAEIQLLDSELRALTLEAEKQEVQKQEISMRIEESEQKIMELTDEINKNNELLEQRLRAMYMNGTGGYLEIILDAENLIDALTRMDLIQLIIKSDVELLKTISEQKTEVEELKVAQETRRLELTAIINDLNAKQNEVMIASRSKENYMVSLQNNIEEILRQEAAMEEQSKQIEKDIIALQRAVEYVGGELMWPLPGHYRITSEYGGRIHPITGKWSTHGGMDIAAPYGTDILAANGGVVIFAGYHYSYGNYIIVDHGGGIATLYAHCSRLLAREGQAVAKGEAIAKIGSTGESTGNHLHFEVRLNGVRKNPIEYLKAR
ncbi:MAG: peptidoglycan DD-metalloendopeptidase family protein [Bacillota bacterium]|jgi:murein DD-endopeptidase MepM/ murein hydrolase activator NlpD|nr:peptidoglycan DD-metalloendopeptidase family protein [Bacillota bacterium]NLL59523.1 peptidoglycan DD-metalloendopeptidase family protein [Tissierellia bacterium]